jgi:hypothetical protein
VSIVKKCPQGGPELSFSYYYREVSIVKKCPQGGPELSFSYYYHVIRKALQILTFK